MLEVELKKLLDRVFVALSGGAVCSGFTELLRGLNSMCGMEQWPSPKEQLRKVAMSHPIADLLHQDPYTRHAYNKPRGYAGDAQLLDFVYGMRHPPEGTTMLGREIFTQCMATKSSYAVRYRRDLMARYIDSARSHQSTAKVLSLACGHVREAKDCAALTSDRVKLYGFDHDRLTVEHARQMCDGLNVEINTGSVIDAINGKLIHDKFSLVYSAGLYDYLSDAIASKLTAKLFELLEGGGKLVIGNFSRNSSERVYMDLFMDWTLNYRDKPLVSALTREVPQSDISSAKVFSDPEGCVLYLEIQRV